MKIQFLGHAGFLIDDLLIDPFISGNPLAKVKPEDIKCKVICVTHNHPDHLGDAFEIAKRNNATIVGIHEIAVLAQEKGLKAEGMNIGGKLKINKWQIKMEIAFHSSASGMPCSFILKKDNKVLYHAGDTGYFSDMERFKEYNIDIAFIPIGDRYTMGIEDALKCIKAINCKIAVPMHYATFPFIEQNPSKFKERCTCRCEVFEIGEVKNL